uniref:Pleckstrin homology domain containing, family A member 7b n=1 Tax=Electrophorus electricus TaxID=8005 RepID=A0A4W4F2J7_ELEEL
HSSAAYIQLDHIQVGSREKLWTNVDHNVYEVTNSQTKILSLKKEALEKSLRTNGDSGPSYFSMTQSPPTTPNSLKPVTTSSPMSSYQEQARRLYTSERPPLSVKVPAHSPNSMPSSPRRSDPRDPPLPYSRPMIRNRSQDNLIAASVSRHVQASGSLLSMWNGTSSPTPGGSSGAASMPSSPRLARRQHTQDGGRIGGLEPLPRQRKYSAGSLTGMGSHSRSLPRLYRPVDSHLPLPPTRRSLDGKAMRPSLTPEPGPLNGHSEVVSISLSARSISKSAPAPPDVTVASSVTTSPRQAKKLSLTTGSSYSDLEKQATGGPSPVLELGLGERRQSFGKAGLGPQGGFRERKGSISSLSGKEELQDYHQRQRDERLRDIDRCLHLPPKDPVQLHTNSLKLDASFPFVLPVCFLIGCPREWPDGERETVSLTKPLICKPPPFVLCCCVESCVEQSGILGYVGGQGE